MMNIGDYRERFEAYRDRMPDMQARIEEWRDELPEPEVIETVAGAAMLGIGVVAALAAFLSGRRGIWAWALPGDLLTGGAAVLIAGAHHLREERIEVAEEAIRRLDPIARAKVMKEIAEEQLSVLTRKGAEA